MNSLKNNFSKVVNVQTFVNKYTLKEIMSRNKPHKPDVSLLSQKRQSIEKLINSIKHYISPFYSPIPKNIHHQNCHFISSQLKSENTPWTTLWFRRVRANERILTKQQFGNDKEVKYAVREWLSEVGCNFINEGVENLVTQYEKRLNQYADFVKRKEEFYL